MGISFSFSNNSPILPAIAAPLFKEEPAETSLIEELAFQRKFDALREQRKCLSAALRLEIIKSLLEFHPNNVEQVDSKIVRMMFDFDLEFLQRTVKEWPNRTKEAKAALENISTFMASQQLPERMSLQEHAALCYKLSALISGVNLQDLDKEYDKQLHTMVTGVVHPQGRWTPKSEIEDQSYAKYLFHVSKKGLVGVSELNYLTSFRANPASEFISVRLIAVPCEEVVGFDGIEDCGSLRVLRHDFIHAGFLKYAQQTNPERFRNCLEKVGLIGELFRADPNLPEGSLLRKQVEAAFFMWTHELTTSVFVDGWPRKVPTENPFLGDISCSLPQVLLRFATKLNVVPKIFSQEIYNEGMLLKSLGIEVEGLEDPSLSDHEKIKRIMKALDPGYKYLAKNFGEYYGKRSYLSVLALRAYSVALEFFEK